MRENWIICFMQKKLGCRENPTRLRNNHAFISRHELRALCFFYIITQGKHLNEFEWIVEYLLKAFHEINQRCPVFSCYLSVHFHMSQTAIPAILSFFEASVKWALWVKQKAWALSACWGLEVRSVWLIVQLVRISPRPRTHPFRAVY